MAKKGRPSKYGGIDLKQAKKLAMKGWTDLEMSSFFGIDVSTWHRWKGLYPEFCDALKEWKSEADENVERSLYQRAMGYSCVETKVFAYNGKVEDSKDIIKHYPPDTTACLAWLNNRQPDKWRQKKDPEEADNDEQITKVEIVRRVKTD